MKPKLSVVVNFFNMRREAERTLFTLSAPYQRGVSAEDYEVIAVDNGSTEPLGADFVSRFGPNFAYLYFDADSPSPAKAINHAARLAQGDLLTCIIDGARMLTPGLVDHSINAARIFAHPFICTLAWHLGSKLQNRSMLEGYNREVEDRLLETVDWRNNGYQLFEISVLAGSSKQGFFGGTADECNCFTMRHEDYSSLGGFDERFTTPGGGLVNLDFFERAVTRSDIDHVLLLGEGSFHQIHGGVATNVTEDQHPGGQFLDEYRRLRGKSYQSVVSHKTHYFGHMPDEALRFLNPDRSAQLASSLF